jgi:hypothetical protein
MRPAAWLGLAAIAFATTASADTRKSKRRKPPVRDTGGEVAPVVVEDPKPWLGISFNQGGGGIGVPVTHVFEESAALACGVQIGDLIYAVDGVPLDPYAGVNLGSLITSHAVGDRVELQVVRDDRMITLHPVLAARVSDTELLHRQLVGRDAPEFVLHPPIANLPSGVSASVQTEADADAEIVADDTALIGKVGILTWFHTSCTSCPNVANQVATWVDAHRDAVGIAGIGGSPAMTLEQIQLAAHTILSMTPVLMPAGVDQNAWLTYGAMQDSDVKVAVAVVDRGGVIRMAAAIDATTDDPAALDDVFAAAERLLKQRTSRR